MRTHVALVLALLTPSAGLAAKGVRYADYRDYPAGSSPIAMAVADVNHDGIPDVVSAGGGLSVLLGRRDGSLAPAIGVGSLLTTSVAVADFNNDGKLDIAAVMVPNGNEITLALGNGDGTFQTPIVLPIGCVNHSCALVAADFNGDGNMDLAISFNLWVTLYLGNGDGTFRSGQPTYGMTSSIALATADLNQDGKPDLVVSDQIINHLVVLLGNGDGSFQRRDYPGGYSPYALVLADFNGDGLPDVAVSEGQSTAIQVRLNQGGGVLGSPVSYQTSCTYCNLESITAGDFNHDGKTDLATPESILYGNGDGTFQTPETFASGSAPDQVVSADFNHDGYSDLVTGGLSSTDLTVLLCGPRGVQQPPGLAVGSGPWAAAVADFNGDGKADLAVALEGENQVRVYAGLGNGTFTESASFSLQSAGAVVAVDFNGDGKIDLAASGENGTVIYLGNGDGTFTEKAQYAGVYGSCTMNFWPSHPCFAVADLNNDGIPDLVGALWIQYQVFILLGNGDGTFRQLPTMSTTDVPQSIVVGDFNHDGNVDLAISGYGGTIAVYPGNGDGTFGSPTILSLPFGGLGGLAVGDMNGDGNPDIVVAGGGAGSLINLGIFIFTGNGDLTFNAPVTLIADENPNWVLLADLNGDGKLDIASANVGANNVSILLNEGNLNFAPELIYGVGASPVMLTTANLFGKPQSDLIVVNQDSGSLTFLPRQGK